MIHITR